MSETITIKNFSSLLSLPPLKKLKEYKIARLTAPGENYGSLMLSVDVTLDTSGGNENIHLVAKMVPPNVAIQEIFNTSVTFRNEIEFYRKIVPTLENFQLQFGSEVVDFYPKYFGSRLNLTGSEHVDSDAILLLENLKIANYVGVDRSAGLDMPITRLILRNLAALHAVPIGLKLHKPEVFNTEVRPYLSPWLPKKEMHDKYRAAIVEMVAQIPEISHLEKRILEGFDRELLPEIPREPFATIAHNDCWVSNSLVKFDKQEAVDCKLVDYQVCGYGSPARDVLFFLFSSVKIEVLERWFEDLLKWYYENFISLLKGVKCDVQKFGFEEFEKELDFEARNSQFGHVAFMLFVVFTDKSKVKDISEFSVDNIIAGAGSEEHKRKFAFVVKEFAKRNWI
ncbi:uncharacterized protein LOC123008492 [Tribolium madens]|uniref:uncharacterized protein LOC123008492 n=1 Tax=Tribolium madens TaxID=41895 RepID=UPI001CF764D6|nr:uncharacterized protein LOC123008492 [Tribolium madens]